MSHLDGAHRVSILSGGNDLKILVVHGSIAHDQTIRGLKGLLTKRLLVPWLYNRADILVTVSRELVGELATLGVDREKIVTINNIIDAPAIRSNAALAIPDHDHVIFKGRPTLITTGRLHPQKNPIGLLQAFAQLLQSRSARLLSLGDGPLRKAAVECAEALGLRTAAWWRGDIPDADHDVHFLGPRRNPFPYLRAADLFVLPSLWEGFPLSLCEALACGVPSIAADCPTGPREILAPSTAAPHRLLERPETGEFGMLMPLLQGSASAEVWAKSFVGLLDDEATRGRLSRAGMRRIEDFSASRILPQWLTLIERLSDSRR